MTSWTGASAPGYDEPCCQLFDNMREGYAHGLVIVQGGRAVDVFCLKVNRAFGELTGLKDVVGRRLAEVIPGIRESSPELIERCGRVGMTGEPDKFETRLTSPSGAWFSVSVFSPIAGEFVAVIDNITERKRAEHGHAERHETIQALMRERYLLRTLIDALPDRIYIKDRDARKTLANLTDVRELGVASERDVLGKTDHDLLDRDTADACLADDLRVITRGEAVVNRQELIPTSDGRQRWLETTKLPLRDDTGQIVGLAGIGHDITERKRIEREREVMEVQLRQAQKLESIGQLAAGIAHEINTPLQYVGDNIHFLQDAFDDLRNVVSAIRDVNLDVKSDHPAIAEALAPVNAALQTADLDYLLERIPHAIDASLEGVERVTKIVRALKEFSHPGTEQMVAVDLNHAIDSTIAVARNAWKYVADLVTDFDPTLPPVFCHPSEFNQVILNIIINAAHAIADSVSERQGAKGLITVRTRSDGTWVETRVEDTGTGIPEAVRERIFDPFFTTKSVGRGSGQGLAIARSVVVDKHGGTLTFETEVGRGTTFIIRLPLRASQTAQPASG